jgi:hypothetical protein
MSSFFDDEATLAMGAAFDVVCASLRGFSRDNDVREVIAKRIIESAAKGERDPVRLHLAGLRAIRMDDLRVPIICYPRTMPAAMFAAKASTH